MGYFVGDTAAFLAKKDATRFDTGAVNRANHKVFNVVPGTVYSRDVTSTNVDPIFYENLDGVDE